MTDGSIKSPDYSMYEYSPKVFGTAGWPTVVWEVAASEDEKKLAYDLGRYITCSSGRVLLAIGLKIEFDPAPKGPKQPRNLKRVICTFWETEDIQCFATLEESGSELDRLTRCDEYVDQDLDYVVPPVSKLSCVTQILGEYVKFIGSQSAIYTVSTFFSSGIPLRLMISVWEGRFFLKIQMDPQRCTF